MKRSPSHDRSPFLYSIYFFYKKYAIHWNDLPAAVDVVKFEQIDPLWSILGDS